MQRINAADIRRSNIDFPLKIEVRFQGTHLCLRCKLRRIGP
jgi:hypothetical protein